MELHSNFYISLPHPMSGINASHQLGVLLFLVEQCSYVYYFNVISPYEPQKYFHKIIPLENISTEGK